MITITLLLLVAAFIVLIASALGKAPLWIAVLLMLVVQLLSVLPIR